MTETKDELPDGVSSIGVTSAPVGVDQLRYGVELSLGDLLVWRLDGDQILRYVQKAYVSASIAEHSFATFRLLTDQLGMDKTTAAQFMREDYSVPKDMIDACRADDVCPVDWASAFTTRHPYIKIFYKGGPLGSLMPDDLRAHGAAVLDASAAARLDTALLRMLTDHVGVDSNRARHFVNDLQKHWFFEDDAEPEPDGAGQ